MCCVLRFVGCDRTYATMTAEKTAIVSWRIRFATRVLRKSAVTESREPFYTWCCKRKIFKCCFIMLLLLLLLLLLLFLLLLLLLLLLLFINSAKNT